MLQSDIPYIQEHALKALPAPVPIALQGRLRAIVESSDVDAAIAACRIVARDKLAGLREPVLQVLRTAKEEWLFRAASNAAIALDAKYERLQVLVARLDEPDMLIKCMDGLKTVFGNTGGGGSNSNIDLAAEGKRVKPQWEAFIKRHEEHLRAGKTFDLPHPEILPEMLPEGYHVSLTNGKNWPKQKWDR